MLSEGLQSAVCTEVYILFEPSGFFFTTMNTSMSLTLFYYWQTKGELRLSLVNISVTLFVLSLI